MEPVELKTWLSKITDLSVHKRESVEGPVRKRVVRKIRKLARILGEQWTEISAVGFLLIFLVHLFNSAVVKKLASPKPE